MKNKKTTIQDLNEIHNLISGYYGELLIKGIETLKTPEKIKIGKNKTILGRQGLIPAELTAINNFLKQNEIFVEISEQSSLKDILGKVVIDTRGFDENKKLSNEEEELKQRLLRP